MGSNKRILILLLIFPLFLHAQTDRYFVYFKDKTHTPFSLSNPQQFLSTRSIYRRQLQNISYSNDDLPADPAYVAQVRATGAGTYFTSKWFNGVLVQTDVPTITQIQSLPFVSKVQLVAHNTRLTGGRLQKRGNQKQINRTNTSPEQTFQISQIGLDKMQQAGFLGDGVNIAIFDSGFIGVNKLSTYQPLFQNGQIKATFNFVINSTDVYSADNHGSEVMSILAANTSGGYIGGVYHANYFLYQTEDVASEYRIEEFNWTFAAERADSAGVDVINSSVGYNTFDDSSMDYQYADLNGNTAIISIAARKASDKGMIVVNSAGNEGSTSWKYVTPPADADHILAVGSVDENQSRSFFSSFGPTSDGRFKPDVMAMGNGAAVISESGSIVAASGTSLSSPLVASLAAGMRQAYPSLSALEIITLLKTTASQANDPDNIKGYGIPFFILPPASSEKISIYPNPVNGNTVKIFVSSPSETPVHLEVFSLAGQKVIDTELLIRRTNNPFEYDLSQLGSGLYVFKVSTVDYHSTIRILKQD